MSDAPEVVSPEKESSSPEPKSPAKNDIDMSNFRRT